MEIGKKMVIHSLLFNNRLKRYQEYIKNAQSHGYEVISLEKFYQLKDRRKGKHFVLRHDVDSPGKYARKMYEAEKKAGVRSTYYFRFSSLDVALARDMIRDGFDVGLHFETISDYARENGIKDKSQIDIELMRNLLKQDIAKFEKRIGHKTYSCCSHGAAENVRLGISNNAITEDCDVKKLGIEFEAYSKTMYDDVDCHIMDKGIISNFGFSYADTPISAVKDKHQNIIFLAHPEHWWYTFAERGFRMALIIFGRGEFKQSTRVFKRIAK